MKTMHQAFGILLFFAALFTASSSGAQSVLFGAKAGINVNNISSPSVEGDFKSNIKPGFHIGPFVQVQIGRRVSFKHEMLFMMKGFNSTVKGDSGASENYRVTYNYIDLPWMLNFHFNERLWVNVGVVPSLYLGGKVPGDFERTIFDKTNVAPIDFAPMIGVEGFITDHFGAGMRFTYSAIPVIDVTGHQPKLYTIQLYGTFGKYAGVRYGKKRR